MSLEQKAKTFAELQEKRICDVPDDEMGEKWVRLEDAQKELKEKDRLLDLIGQEDSMHFRDLCGAERFIKELEDRLERIRQLIKEFPIEDIDKMQKEAHMFYSLRMWLNELRGAVSKGKSANSERAKEISGQSKDNAQSNKVSHSRELDLKPK